MRNRLAYDKNISECCRSIGGIVLGRDTITVYGSGKKERGREGEREKGRYGDKGREMEIGRGR